MLKKPNILVVGSFMMDLIASTARAPKSGETVIGMKFQTAPGGKGANQAVQCARLGAHVTMVGRVGDDAFGTLMTETAAKAGVDVSHVSVDPAESSGVGHITLEVVEAVAEWAKAAGTPVMINPAPAAPMSDRLLACASYLSPNEHEAAELAGHPIDVSNGVDLSDVEAVAKAFQARGVENLIITMGENGSFIAGKDGIHQTPCVKMPHVADPTAAGDSFVAAFCTGLTAGLPQGEALAFASHTAAITVSRMGAMPSLPTVDEVQQLLRERDYRGFDPAELDALK